MLWVVAVYRLRESLGARQLRSCGIDRYYGQVCCGVYEETEAKRNGEKKEELDNEIDTRELGQVPIEICPNPSDIQCFRLSYLLQYYVITQYITSNTTRVYPQTLFKTTQPIESQIGSPCFPLGPAAFIAHQSLITALPLIVTTHAGEHVSLATRGDPCQPHFQVRVSRSYARETLNPII